MNTHSRTLTLFGVITLLATMLVAVAGIAPSGASSPIFDSDGDHWNDLIEQFLGSDWEDINSTPEHIAVPLTCMDQLDNDLDTLVDAADPGCDPPPIFRDEFPPAGLDIFDSTMSLSGYQLDTSILGLGICGLDIELTGPVVVSRGDPEPGTRTIQTEILSMQLTGDGTINPGPECTLPAPQTFPMTIVESPAQPSLGEITPVGGGTDFPADSFFDVFFEVVIDGVGVLPGGPPGGPAGAPVRLNNQIKTIPPYHSPAPGALNPGCYEVAGLPHEHCPKPPLDHFKCYAGRFDGFTPRLVGLQDQFLFTVADVVRPFRFCNVVDKNSEGVFDENAHLKVYKIASPDAFAVEGLRVDVQNQFGLQRLRVRALDVLAVPTQKHPHEPPLALDHFACYRVAGKSISKRVALADQWENRRAWVLKPYWLCNPVDKTDEAGVVTPAGDPEWHLVCYRLKAAKPKPHRAALTNQFGDELFRARRVTELCVPSAKFHDRGMVILPGLG